MQKKEYEDKPLMENIVIWKGSRLHDFLLKYFIY